MRARSRCAPVQSACGRNRRWLLLDAVPIAGGVRGDVPIQEIGADFVGRPLERVAVAAATAGGAAYDIALLQLQAVRLEYPTLVRLAGIDDHLGARRVLPAEQAPRGLTRALEPQRHGQVRLRLVFANDAVAAAVLSGAAGVRA